MKLWPSAEDLIDGNQQQVLGLMWNIMLRFMKVQQAHFLLLMYTVR